MDSKVNLYKWNGTERTGWYMTTRDGLLFSPTPLLAEKVRPHGSVHGQELCVGALLRLLLLLVPAADHQGDFRGDGL